MLITREDDETGRDTAPTGWITKRFYWRMDGMVLRLSPPDEIGQSGWN